MEVLYWLLYIVIGAVFTAGLVRFNVINTGYDEDFAMPASFVSVTFWPLVVLALVISCFWAFVYNGILYLGGKK